MDKDNDMILKAKNKKDKGEKERMEKNPSNAEIDVPIEDESNCEALLQSDSSEGSSDGNESGCCDDQGAEYAALKQLCQTYERDAIANHEKYLRALADFENYKRRAIKERSELVKYQGERIFQDLLEMVDNFERALQSADSDPGQLKTGLEMVYKSLIDVFTKYEVRAESAVGENFDPNKHSALGQVVVDDTSPGTIVSELKKAYFYKDKLIRVAEVVVAKEPEASDRDSVDETV
ncbi:MAG: nucleotide exchange factor GrpE [Bdellovibrionales bacterium]|nr:nucleotide exchange factor GrpE [Bdellovibrionales bacterium]